MDFIPKFGEQTKKEKKMKMVERTTQVTATYDFQRLTNRIAQYLYTYSLKTRSGYTKANPKFLGTVGFWLEETTSGQTVLMYTIHPKDWNVNSIAAAYENEERSFFESTEFKRGSVF